MEESTNSLKACWESKMANFCDEMDTYYISAAGFLLEEPETLEKENTRTIRALASRLMDKNIKVQLSRDGKVLYLLADNKGVAYLDNSGKWYFDSFSPTKH